MINMQKRICSLLLIASMLFSMSTPIFAATEGDNTVPVELNAVAAAFKVTVPTELPVDVDAMGHSHVANNAQIINNSRGPIKISNISVESQNNWTLVPFDSDFSTFRVDEKNISFKMFEQDAHIGIAYADPISALGEVNIPYDSSVALQSQAVDIAPLKVVFTFGWNDGDLDQYLSDEGFYFTVENNQATIVGAENNITSATALSIPSSVTLESTSYETKSIGDAAFQNETAIETLSIDNGVTMIGNESFDGCTGLTDVTIPQSVSSIGNSVFGRTSANISILGRNNSDGMSLGTNWNGESTVLFPDKEIPLEDISIGSDFSIEKGESKTLSVTYTPDTATNKPSPEWSSSVPEIVSIDASGKVTAIKPGTTTISATVGSIIKSIRVTVISTLTDINIGEDITLNKGATSTIVPEFIPADTTDSKELTFESSNPSVASVSSVGLITALGVGTATITASGANNIVDSKIITVVSPLTDISIGSDFSLEKGTNKTLSVTYTPSDTTDSNIILWESSNPEVATVVNGKVSALSIGQSTITATVGDISKSVKVTVTSKLTGIDIGNDITLGKGKTANIYPTFIPSDTTDSRNISYESSNTAIATVSSAGVVKGISPGVVTITAKGANNVTASIKVTVISTLTDINIGSNFILEKGDSKTISVTYTPADTTDDKTVTWKSSNTTIATVSNGVVTAVAPGTATITATVGSISKSVAVTVTSSLISIDIGSNFTLAKGGTRDLVVSYNPSDTTDSKTVSWKSSNTAVATVVNGKVTAIGVGSATITATVGSKIDTLTVTVTSALTSISIGSDITLAKGLTSNIVPVFTPADTTDSKTLSYESSNTNIATVSSSGVITAVNPGVATITATGANNLTATKKVTVTSPLTAINIGSNFSLEKESNKTLSVTYIPADTTDDKSVVWRSGNTSVATVSDLGVVSAVGVGSTTITATVGEVSKSVTVNVTSRLTGISLGGNITLAKGKTFTISPIYTPSDTTDSKSISYVSSNTAVATVDSNGMITGVSVGTTTITGTGANGVTSTKTVTVNSPLTSIDIGSDFTLSKGGSKNLSIVYIPSDTTDSKTATWQSSNTKVATVSNGAVSAVGNGTATITATVGSISKSVVVTVTTTLTSISIGNDITLAKGKTATITPIFTPADTTDSKVVVYESDNPSVATVSSTGVITAKGVGVATITATGAHGLTATKKVTVNNPVTSVVLNKSSLSLEINGSSKLTATINPSDTTDTSNVTWVSSNNAVATVDSNGNVTAIKSGTATITASKGGKSASCVVTVTAPFDHIEIFGTDMTTTAGFISHIYGAAVTTDGGYLPLTSWTSSNPAVASINENYVDESTGQSVLSITANKAGESTITAYYGSVSKTIVVTVLDSGDSGSGSGSNTIVSGSGILTDNTGIVSGLTDSDEIAMYLNSIGMLDGEGTDIYGEPIFALDDMATRVQGLVLFVKAIDAEEAEMGYMQGRYSHPFGDVPSYADAYVAYAYTKGITTGVTNYQFNPDGQLTSSTYLTFILRQLGYEEGVDFIWDNATGLAKDVGLLYNVPVYEYINRRSMVVILYNSLFAVRKEGTSPGGGGQGGIPETDYGPELSGTVIIDADNPDNLIMGPDGNLHIDISTLPEGSAIVSNTLGYSIGAGIDENLNYFKYAINALDPNINFYENKMDLLGYVGPDILNDGMNYWNLILDNWGCNFTNNGSNSIDTSVRTMMLTAMRYFGDPDMANAVYGMLDEHYRFRSDNSVEISEELAAKYGLTIVSLGQLGEYMYQAEVSNGIDTWIIDYAIDNPQLSSATNIAIPIR